MKPRQVFNHLFALVVALLSILLTTSAALGQATSFTYQGRLTDGGTAANGNYDLQFALWDSASGGAQIGSTVTLNTVPVSNGVFSVSLDFGAGSFNGANRFLEISARPNGGSFTLLSPRQQVTSTPYAIRSVNASSADSATNATQLGGVAAAQYVQTNDTRLTDARAPTVGSANYIQNTTAAQAATNFNISGTGTADILGATTEFDLKGARIVGTYNGGGNGGLFVGFGAGNSNTSSTQGSDNAFFGNFAGQKTTDGGENAFFGSLAGNSNTTGAFNSFFGAAAGLANLTGQQNSYFGGAAGNSNSAGSSNSYFGSSAGSRGTGDGNTFIGARADFSVANAAGTNNTLLGSESIANPGVTNSTAIGFRAVAVQSNSVVIGSINGAGSGTADTNVGIGSIFPTKRLEVRTLTVGDGISLFGPGVAYLLSDVTKTEKAALGFAGNAGLYSTDAAAGDVVLRATNRLILQHGAAGAGLILTGTGTVAIPNLGAAGGSQLCRNSNNEISNCSSSLRYKTKVLPFAGGLDIINRLRPISFEWKQDHVKDIGLGAEEVARVEPLLTFRNPQGVIEGVKYNQLSAVFINAIKEQQVQIDALRRENAGLNARLRNLEQRPYQRIRGSHRRRGN
ncbi:MAG TPA: tail fiber domain-containing protein [Pyrinomonadaceae bacterium]|nr:tail fiber domain-containing protein [Pyrinomonadaceae bacterium]